MDALVTILLFTGRLVCCIKIERRTWVGSKAGEQDVIAVNTTVKTGACREKFNCLAFFRIHFVHAKCHQCQLGCGNCGRNTDADESSWFNCAMIII
jgi:hypothetical protein